jgi:hypothetical protein
VRNVRTAIRRHRGIEVRNEPHLRYRWPAILGLQFEGKHLARVQQDQISHTSSHAERFDDGGLNRPALATVWRVPPKKAANPAKLKMLAYGSLNAIFVMLVRFTLTAPRADRGKQEYRGSQEQESDREWLN